MQVKGSHDSGKKKATQLRLWIYARHTEIVKN